MQKNKLLKILLSLFVLIVLFLQVDFAGLRSAFVGLSLSAISLLMLISMVLLYTSALKWSYFLHKFGSKVSVLRLFALYFLGYFVNLIAPSYIGGDAARSYYIGKDVGQHAAAAATILERYTGLVAMITLGLVFAWFVDLVTLPMKLAIIGAAVALFLVTMLALSPRIMHRLEKFTPIRKIVPHLSKIQDGFKIAKANPSLIIKSLALSYLYHTFTVINVVATAYVVGWAEPPLTDIFVALPLVLLICAIPLTPNSLGIQEGAYFYFLTGLGASSSQALAIGLILRAKQYVLAVVGGLVFLFEGYGAKRALKASPQN
jgi:uncharacterized protein (TIRG00374 family)